MPKQIQPLIMNFEIINYSFFESRSNKHFLRFTFLLSNENEEFEKDQIFLIEDDGDFHKSFYDFIDQFACLVELKDDLALDDFIGEKGTCYLKNSLFNGKIYRNIKIKSLE